MVAALVGMDAVRVVPAVRLVRYAVTVEGIVGGQHHADLGDLVHDDVVPVLDEAVGGLLGEDGEDARALRLGEVPLAVRRIVDVGLQHVDLHPGAETARLLELAEELLEARAELVACRPVLALHDVGSVGLDVVAADRDADQHGPREARGQLVDLPGHVDGLGAGLGAVHVLLHAELRLQVHAGPRGVRGIVVLEEEVVEEGPVAALVGDRVAELDVRTELRRQRPCHPGRSTASAAGRSRGPGCARGAGAGGAGAPAARHRGFRCVTRVAAAAGDEADPCARERQRKDERKQRARELKHVHGR